MVLLVSGTLLIPDKTCARKNSDFRDLPELSHIIRRQYFAMIFWHFRENSDFSVFESIMQDRIGMPITDPHKVESVHVMM